MKWNIAERIFCYDLKKTLIYLKTNKKTRKIVSKTTTSKKTVHFFRQLDSRSVIQINKEISKKNLNKMK